MTKVELARFRKRKARILSLIAAGKSQAEIARMYGIKRQRVNQIVNGRIRDSVTAAKTGERP